jgi:hypothetical protein
MEITTSNSNKSPENYIQQLTPYHDHNQQMMMIPEAAFIRLAGPNSNGSIEHMISIIQNHNHALMDEWIGTYPIERIDNIDEPFWRDIKGQCLIIPPDQGLKCELMNIWHKGSVNGHPGEMKQSDKSTGNTSGPAPRRGSWNTSKAVQHAKKNKNLTHRIKTLMFRIPSTISTKPFSHIAMDLITGLPKSEGHNAILVTIETMSPRLRATI